MLSEINWIERTPLTRILTPHRGKHRFVHFSQVNKLGINPKKSHTDPHGIYFYAIDWLFSDTENLATGRQYGFGMPFWTIAEVDLTHAITLSKITAAQVEAIADRNGWRAALDAYHAGDERFKYAVNSNRDYPGAILWGVVRTIVGRKETTWRKAMAGISAIYDDGKAIIDSHEPDQLLVFDPKTITIIDHGKQNPVKSDSTSDNKLSAWREGFSTITKALRGLYGGQITWKHQGKEDYPSITFEVNGATFDVLPVQGNWGDGVYLRVNYAWKRAKGSERIDNKALRDQSPQAIIDSISAIVDRISAFSKRGLDLFFKPFLDEKAVKDFISTRMTGLPVKITTTIDYERDPKHGRMLISGSRTVPMADKSMTIAFECLVTPEYLHPRIDILFGEERFLTASRRSIKSMDEADAVMAELYAYLIERLDIHFEDIGPTSHSMRKIYNEDTLSEARGFVAKHIGIPVVIDHFKDDIAAFENSKQKKNALSDLEFATARGW